MDTKVGHLCSVRSATVILLFSAFESQGGKCYPCQIVSCNSNGKLDYFERNFHIRFAAITQLKNVRESHGKLGRVECHGDVMLSKRHHERDPFSIKLVNLNKLTQ